MAPTSPAPAERKPHRLTLALFLLSFSLHFAVVLAIHHYRNPLLWENGNIAQYLYAGKGFRIDYYGRAAEPTSVQAPGYPVVLWGFYKMFGETPRAYLMLSMAQCLSVASMVWPMGMLSRRWFPEAPPWIAQALVTLYPLYLWYCTRLHHTAFVMAMHPWLLWSWLACCRRTAWEGIATGIFSGIAGLFQPVLLGVYALCGAGLLAGAVFGKQWKPAVHLILAAIAVIACLLPWTIRNYKVHGRLILIKDGMAKELWMGNNPHATGTSFAQGGAGEITNVYPPKAYSQFGKVSEIQMDDALQAEAWAYMKANPEKTVGMTLKKLVWFWTTAPENLLRAYGEGEALKFHSIDLLYWFGILALALLGVLTAKNPLWEYLAMFAIYFLVYSAIYGITHVGQARFRGEIEFIFLFPAAAGLHFLAEYFSRKPAARLPAT
jgi:hypothetical protein